MYNFWKLYSMVDLIKWIFSCTVKCVEKCGGEWVKQKYHINNTLLYQMYQCIDTIFGYHMHGKLCGVEFLLS